MNSDKMYMRRALQLARNGEGFTSPNPMVGCVIVSQGKIIGEGWHRKCGEAHAEVNAVKSVRDTSLLQGATLYVTLEPCSHYGKTPPCADMVAALPVSHVVVGMKDPFPAVSGRGIQKLLDAGKTVDVGVLEDECRRLNDKFITAHTLRRPFITLKWAKDAQGMMGFGDAKTRSALYSNPLSAMRVHHLRSLHDAIMVGTNTAISDNPKLDLRFWYGRTPRAVVPDFRGRIPSNLNILSRAGTLILRESESLTDTVQRLYQEEGITSLLVEGGAGLLQSFIDANLWDEAHIETNPTELPGDLSAPTIHGEEIHTTFIRKNRITVIRNSANHT
jgi:diaminohydroxyphosphoribosylaminopyrimidine deaminase/5-amino-6-(5-phosphoribosylamino)uracil reductase